MNRNKTVGILIGAAAFAAFAALTPGQNDLGARIKRVENGLAPVAAAPDAPGANILDRMDALKVPGAGIAVINNFKVEWAKGYGAADAETKEPVGVSTLFQAASISKPVTAMAVLKLVQDRRLDLDADVNSALMSWKLPGNEFTAGTKVTLKHLLSHTGGLTVHGFPGYAIPGPVPTLLMVLDGVKPANTPAIRVDQAPGRAFRYSGGGYEIVQQILLDVEGKTFPELMRELVLSPIGMYDSTFEQPLPADQLGGAAAGHGAGGTPIPGKRHTYPEMAAAGLWTTPTDLAAFAIEIQKGALGRSNKVLSRATAEKMLTPVLQNYGLGLGIDPAGGYFQHDGSNAGFTCFLYAGQRSGKGVVVMTNSDVGGPLFREILRSVAREYAWENFFTTDKAAPKK
jgi:CubicO group peptidase (beta-lactamase class C family)